MREGISWDPETRREQEKETIYLRERLRLGYEQDRALELTAV